MSTVIKLLPDQ